MNSPAARPDVGALAVRRVSCRFVQEIGVVLVLTSLVLHGAELPVSNPSRNATNAPVFGSAVDLFKDYLRRKPAIESLLCERQVLILPPLPGIPSGRTGELQFYQTASQRDNFYLRRLRAPDQADTLLLNDTITAGLLFAGKWENWRWYIVNLRCAQGFSLEWACTPDGTVRYTMSDGNAIQTCVTGEIEL